LIKDIFVKNSIRVLKWALLCSILIFMGISRRFIKGGFNLNDIPAILVGSFCGLVLVLIMLRRSFGFAKKGIFVEPPSKRGRNIILSLTLILSFILGLTMGIVNKYHYSLGIDLSALFNVKSLEIFLFVYSATGAIGIYVLEHKYGQKYYFGR